VSTWINGIAARELSTDDRGLSYGDGLFETMHLERGAVARLERHLKRLTQGCARLGIDCVADKLLREEIEARARTLSDGVLKLVITRGAGPRGYRPTGEERPTWLLSWNTARAADASLASAGVRVRFCRTPATENAAIAGLKHLNRLDCVLARREWSDPEIAEGLMCDSHGSVVGGTMSNLFAVRDRTLMTPRLDRSGVRGVMRSVVIDAARGAGIDVVEQHLTAQDLSVATELFLTNALIGVWPVRALEATSYPVGALTRRLQQLSVTLP
jgi:4-amino-4-deoxychorismate lyase